jgi:hypothetical protein
MGLSTHGIISKDITAREVFDVIVNLYDKNAEFDVKIDKYDNKECGSIYFKDGEDQRKLFYCIVSDGAEDTEYDEKEHVGLILGYWGNSVEIMSNIVKIFGGYVDENDCDDIGYFHIAKNGDFQYNEYIKQRHMIEDALDENLSCNDKIMIANQILKHKEKLKEIL